MTQISRFTERCVSIAQSATGERGESAAPEGGDGFADYAYVSIHWLRIYLDTSYRMTIDLLKEMPQIARDIRLEPADLPRHRRCVKHSPESRCVSVECCYASWRSCTTLLNTVLSAQHSTNAQLRDVTTAIESATASRS